MKRAASWLAACALAGWACGTQAPAPQAVALEAKTGHDAPLAPATVMPAQTPAATAPAAPAPAPAPATAQEFGAAIDAATPELTLAALLDAPASHAGRTIRTRGTIERVCQRAGCWIEIRDPGAPSAVHVPMAGHAFFLPQSVAGRPCAVQGTVSVAPMSQGRKQHLQAEGAQATELAVSIVATGVRVE